MAHTQGIGNSQVLQSLLGQQDRIASTKKDTNAVQTAAVQTATAAAQPDRAQLSSAGSTLAQASSTNDDVRADKVAAIQASIAAGTYSVPASAVADKLIQSLLG